MEAAQAVRKLHEQVLQRGFGPLQLRDSKKHVLNGFVDPGAIASPQNNLPTYTWECFVKPLANKQWVVLDKIRLAHFRPEYTLRLKL